MRWRLLRISFQNFSVSALSLFFDHCSFVQYRRNEAIQIVFAGFHSFFRSILNSYLGHPLYNQKLPPKTYSQFASILPPNRPTILS